MALGRSRSARGRGALGGLQGDKGERGGPRGGDPLMPFLGKQERDMIFIISLSSDL